MYQDINIYNPLEEYINVYKDKFQKIAAQTFEELAQAAQIDIQSNKKTCKEINAAQYKLEHTQSALSQWNFLKIVLWIGVIFFAYSMFTWLKEGMSPIYISFGILFTLLFLFFKVHPKVAELKQNQSECEETLATLKDKAWKQMSPLNGLYDWGVLTRMITQTIPRLEFDPYFTLDRLIDLKSNYQWNDSFNRERSVIFSHSGLINGNPFVICRTRKMEMGTKTYYGEKTIHWTSRETDSNGRSYTRHHSETLRASVTMPFPTYPERTRLIYGNTAAPHLIFNRFKSGLANHEHSLRYKWNHWKLKRKARNLKNEDFAMMTNEEFETIFNTSNRNNNQQFALLFTPLAQESMLDLLRDNQYGYGDDFHFLKNKMINVILSDHMQELELEMNPNLYKHYNFEYAKTIFYRLNSEYFRAIYFCFAPLLCVPMYQQIRPMSSIYDSATQPKSSFWEHESLANFWGEDKFQHPACVTHSILKTNISPQGDGKDKIQVNAYGYRAEPRITYVSKYGGDGRYHDVPVKWEEYLPVVGQGSFEIKEDFTPKEREMKPLERKEYIHNKTAILGPHSIYRRHITSKL